MEQTDSKADAMNARRNHALHALNLALHGFHQVYIAIIVFGWMFCQTRVLNMIVLLLTLASWYGLGPLLQKSGTYGYCLITDIQWALRGKLGLDERTGGYIKYLADHSLGQNFDPLKMERFAAVVFFGCAAASAATNYLLGSCTPFAAR